jgi:2-polyprenyl-3-methyl-5-hydroxy-6-metoxy-1,4-benzoquinol methylase
MPDWQERLAHDTNPAIRAEHVLRYRSAVPLIATAPVWVDLGCGAGVAAVEALGASSARHAVLVDASQAAIDEAATSVPAQAVTTVQADLTDAADAARVRDAALAVGRDGTITCFEVIEHLVSFVAVLELMVELTTDHGYTAVLSVPNDAFWTMDNPFHETMWGEGAFEELRRMLPADHRVAHQVPVVGSAIVPDGEAKDLQPPAVTVAAERVPSHFIAAFGPRAEALAPQAFAAPADLDGQRLWERQREANLAFLEAEAARLRSQDPPGARQALKRRVREALSGDRA